MGGYCITIGKQSLFCRDVGLELNHHHPLKPGNNWTYPVPYTACMPFMPTLTPQTTPNVGIYGIHSVHGASGRYNLVYVLTSPGTTELATHPGRGTPELGCVFLGHPSLASTAGQLAVG